MTRDGQLFERKGGTHTKGTAERMLRVEQFGSTSVAGLLTKPVIDISVGDRKPDGVLLFLRLISPVSLSPPSPLTSIREKLRTSTECPAKIGVEALGAAIIQRHHADDAPAHRVGLAGSPRSISLSLLPEWP
jgi:hypothetical protein